MAIASYQDDKGNVYGAINITVEQLMIYLLDGWKVTTGSTKDAVILSNDKNRNTITLTK